MPVNKLFAVAREFPNVGAGYVVAQRSLLYLRLAGLPDIIRKESLRWEQTLNLRLLLCELCVL